MRDHQITHARSLYFYKARDWRTECEFRWVLLAPIAYMNSDRFVNVCTAYQFGRLIAESRTVPPAPPGITSYQAESVLAFAPRAMTLTTE
jgi:hypothetical protein